MIAIGHHGKPATLAKHEIKMVVPGKVSQRAVDAAACKTLVRFVVLLRDWRMTSRTFTNKKEVFQRVLNLQLIFIHITRHSLKSHTWSQ